MVETITKLGYEGKVGIQVDVAAGTYWEEDHGTLRRPLLGRAEDPGRPVRALPAGWSRSIPSSSSKTRSTRTTTRGTPILTKELGIQIVGDDLFTTNPARVQQGIDVGRGQHRAAQGEPDRHDHRGASTWSSSPIATATA